LVAVSKTVDPDSIREAAEAGISDFGENRVQELASKVPELAGLAFLRWHFIGRLQRNKVRKAVSLCDVIHSVDSVGLASAISLEAARQHRTIDVFAQVNVSGEMAKAGFAICGLRDSAGTLAALPSLRWRGLMTIAPEEGYEMEVRGIFAAIRRLHSDLAPHFKQGAWDALSMGMTNDFEIAVEEGATHIRVGRAIFGDRDLQLIGGLP
jgi:pyridoxal phosphate enzyme (YggS family)